ncbi:hypothetical protein GCM10017750_15390 [Streptomyces racemochromogenes]
MRSRGPRRTEDHNFWVAAPIQPLDLGLGRIYTTPRVAVPDGRIRGFPVPHWAQRRAPPGRGRSNREGYRKERTRSRTHVRPGGAQRIPFERRDGPRGRPAITHSGPASAAIHPSI